jgi:protein gp37
MGKDSRIEWTHHTFNPWWGCVNVSPACDHCYAETWAKRVGSQVWGPKAERRFFSDAHWKEPLKWNAEAATSGRRRVFCASMADVFENRSDLKDPRARLFELIEATPHLDWLVLTKRIHLVRKLTPKGKSLPWNVWLGTTAENQEYADKRIPYLLDHVEASVRFLSCEPLLSGLDLSKYLRPREGARIDWVIAGGESGPGARPMNPAWAEGLQKQCRDASVAFHFKQWGHWAPLAALDAPPTGQVKTISVFRGTRRVDLLGVGKSAAGRLLRGKTWDQFPRSASETREP